MSESEADKKRNKLGYQRISVACGHCRRRKIRCVMAEGDAQNRCQNCIRLQKQCVFYPVEQQIPPEKSGALSSKASGNPILSSSSSASHSPQELTAGRPFEQAAFPHVTPVPSNAPQGFPSGTYEQTVQAIEYGYRPPEYLRQWSAPGDLTTNTQPTVMTGTMPGYPIGPYSTYAGGSSMQSTPTDTRSYSFQGQEPDRQWHQFPPQPSRAMSYGNFENMQTTYVQAAAPVYAQMQPQFLPQLDMQSVQMQQQISGPQSAPPVVQVQPQQFNPGTAYVYQQQPTQQGWFSGQTYGGFDGGTPGDESRRTPR